MKTALIDVMNNEMVVDSMFQPYNYYSLETKNTFKKNTVKRKLICLFAILLLLLEPILQASAQTTSPAKVSLYAKTGGTEYYTLYPEGIQKEEAYIGGFKFAQLDPQEENIYFYDSILKVIGKINIQSGKVIKVIGKPKSNTSVNYTNSVSFADASLSKLADFTFDKYGNIYILDLNPDSEGNQRPRILKASLTAQTIKEVLNIQDQFKPANNGGNAFNINFSLTGLSSDTAKSVLYSYGACTFSQNGSTGNGAIVLKINPFSSTIDIFAVGKNIDAGIKDAGYSPKAIISSGANSGQNNLSINGIAFDPNNDCYITTTENISSQERFDTWKFTANGNTLKQESFIGDGTGNKDDIGDGGSAKGAYASLFGSHCLCADKNGDIYVADSITNRVRKVLNNSGLITTIIGGGSETLLFNQSKSLKSIALQSPNSLLVDKINNLYIVEPNRILLVNNLITHADIISQLVKIANIAITKVAGVEVKNPKGEASPADLSLDYTYAGNQNVEIVARNIPDGTAIKLLGAGNDGNFTSTIATGMLINGIATIPVIVEAGTTKIIKAETDPFIPAPGVYLPGTEPMIDQGQLPPEPQNQTQKRDEVNRDGNLIPKSTRFNFSESVGWKRFDGSSSTTNNASFDPDNIGEDVTLVDFGPNNNTAYLNVSTQGGMVAFSVWMKTESGEFQVPIGIAPDCPGTSCSYSQYISQGTPDLASLYSYQTPTVNSTWQKYTVTSNSNIDSYGNRSVYIGGLTRTNGKKVYFWGARLENSN